jgi:prepilin-type N-terminal cleavage/methylation domain-containing protein
MWRKRALARSDGFTLVEVLAALAVASVIIVATSALIRNVALYFDRGTRGVNEAERLMLAVDRLTSDFASARFVLRPTENGVAAAFTGEPASAEQPTKIVFVGAGAIATASQREEAVILTVEQASDVTRLVRRRAAWLGPRTRFEDLTPQDSVVLLEGKFDIAFVFGRVTPEGALTWSASWTGQLVIPHFVRLILRDRATGADLLAEADFVVRADAPSACARPGAMAACLSGAPPAPTRPAEPISGRRPR